MSEPDLEAQQASDGGETAGHGGAYGSKGVVGASSPVSAPRGPSSSLYLARVGGLAWLVTNRGLLQLWRRPRRLPAAEEAELEGMPPEFYDEVCVHLCT